MPKNQIRIYLSARIAKEAHFWNSFVCSHLKDPFEVFMPQDHNPCDVDHEKLSKQVYELDLQAMIDSHMGLLLPDYGRDCAWETGWYANSEKPLVIFIDHQLGWLRDWMIKGGCDYVITTNPESYEVLIRDPILKHKDIILIESMQSLHSQMRQIYQFHYRYKSELEVV